MNHRSVLVLIAGLAWAVSAQEFRSTISGSVTDPHNTMVPAAKIDATETRTGVKSSTTTDAMGQYTLPFLSPGEYTISAEANGFKRSIRTNLLVGPGDHPVIDFHLVLGAVTQDVSVTSEVPLLETANASSGQTIATQQVEDFPLNGRTPMMLAQLAMGVISSGAPGAVHPFDNGGAASFSMSGAATQNNELLMDGTADGTWDKRIAYNPPQDAVQEVRVRAFDADASYGHTGGGMAEQITKSGTNRFHGSAYNFNQVTMLSANGFFNNKNGLKISPNIYNQYGASAGAPLYLPKVYDGRNKVFWFFAFEGIRWDTPISPLVTVPTAAERTGDLSALLTAGASYQIYDPLTAIQAGSLISRSPFPNNIIPTSRLNPVALAVLKYFPAPDLTGRNDGLNNYANSISNKEYFDNELSRADFNLSDKHKLFWTFRHNFRHNDTNRTFGFDDPALGNSLSRKNWGTTVDDVYSLTPTTVLNLRANWTRFVEHHWQSSLGFDPTSLGLPSYIASNAQMLSMPAFVFSGASGSSYQNLSDNDQTSQNPYDIFQLFGNVAKMKGNHSLKAGVDAREYRLSGINYGLNQAGSFTFSSAWANGPYTNSAAAPLGQELASFLMGLPSAGSYSENAYYTANTKYFAGFIQDDWRVRPNVTLNLGLRFEHETAETERFNRVVSGFDATATNSVSSAAAAAYAASPVSQIPANAFKALGGVTFASPSNRAAYGAPSNIWSPRLGVSWTPHFLGPHTVLRGGFGMFTYPIGVPVPNQSGFSQTTQLVATNNNYLTPAATLSNPFPTGILMPAGASQGTSTYLGQGITFVDPNTANPYSVRWDFSVERQLTRDLVLEAAYIGNHSVHLTQSQNVNYLPSQYLSTSPFRDNTVINTLSATVTNPFVGLLPNSTSLNGKTVALSALLTPYPEFSGVTMQNTPEGSSYYDSLNARIEKRMSHGLSFIDNFVWSKLMAETVQLNAFMPPQKQIASDNRRLHNVLALTYHLPIGKGQLVGFSSKWANRIVGGWVVNAIWARQAGAPLNWSTNMLYMGGSLNLTPRDVNTAAFDTTRFNTVSAQQLSQNIRTFPTMFANLTQDGNNNLDFSMLKEFQIREGMKLQLRCEAFNSLNHPTFGAPNLSPTSSSFGTITSQANTSRTVQLGARLAW